MKQRPPPPQSQQPRSKRRRIPAITVITASLIGVGGPAFALWQTSATTQTSNIYLASAGFGIKTTGNFVASDNGEPVVLDLGDEFIGAAFDAAKPGQTPLSDLRITGWADGEYGLDYTVEVNTTGSVVAVFSYPLMNGQCTPAALDVYWWNSEGQGDFIRTVNDEPFDLQSVGKPGDRSYARTDKWCITFPIYRVYYSTAAQVKAHYTDADGATQPITATAYWEGRTVRTKDTVAGSHLVITATPILKGNK